MGKIRLMTPEEIKNIETTHYDSGFSMWIEQPGLKGKRVILDASTFLTSGKIKISPPSNHHNGGFKFGTIFSKDDPHEIMLVAIDAPSDGKEKV